MWFITIFNTIIYTLYIYQIHSAPCHQDNVIDFCLCYFYSFRFLFLLMLLIQLKYWNSVAWTFVSMWSCLRLFQAIHCDQYLFFYLGNKYIFFDWTIFDTLIRWNDPILPYIFLFIIGILPSPVTNKILEIIM